MAKTHRRHSYRKSKRWNPGKRRSSRKGRGRGRRNPYGARPGENDISTVRVTRGGRRRNCGRNPATYTKHLSDGSRVEVSRDGQVTVTDRGGVFSRYEVGYGRLAHFINDVKRAGKRSDKYSFQGETLKDEGSYAVKLNPKRGRKSRSHKRRGHRGSKRKSRSHKTHLVGGYGKRRVYEGRSQKRGHRGRRRNPAQFPMPFVSAMNPRRRGRKGRNPKISKREAKAMHRVLRRHGR